MTTIKKSIQVNASVEAVEALLDDPNRLTDWYPGVTKAVASAGYPHEVGSSCNITYKAVADDLGYDFMDPREALKV